VFKSKWGVCQSFNAAESIGQEPEVGVVPGGCSISAQRSEISSSQSITVRNRGGGRTIGSPPDVLVSLNDS